MSGGWKKLFSYQRASEPPDASTFDDPLAERIEWSPCARGGTSFRTHKLVDIDGERIAFRPTMFAFSLYGLFLILGAGFTIAGAVTAFNGGRMGLLMNLVGAVFAAVGGVLLYFSAAPIVFDKRRRLFTKGWRRREVPFDRIHALQLLEVSVSDSEGSFYSYELNLVLDDASRLLVVSHGHLPSLGEDAHAIAAILAVPVWDATARENAD